MGWWLSRDDSVPCANREQNILGSATTPATVGALTQVDRLSMVQRSCVLAWLTDDRRPSEAVRFGHALEQPACICTRRLMLLEDQVKI